jgi:hypothetical protein
VWGVLLLGLQVILLLLLLLEVLLLLLLEVLLPQWVAAAVCCHELRCICWAVHCRAGCAAAWACG